MSFWKMAFGKKSADSSVTNSKAGSDPQVAASGPIDVQPPAVRIMESIPYDLLFTGKRNSYSGYFLALVSKNCTRGTILLEGVWEPPNWSHDGRLIVFYKTSEYGEKVIRLMNRDGSDLRTIAQGEDPSFSPDDQKIVFEWAKNWRTEGANTEIHVMDRDGSHREQLTSTPHAHSNPSFSLDGKSVLYNTNRTGIWAIDLATKKTTRVIEDGFMPCCSPVEPKIAFVRDKMICTADLDGGNVVSLQKGFCPKWSPDGKMIVFTEQMGDRYDSPQQVFIMKSSGKGRKQLTDEQYGCSYPAVF